MNEQQKKFFREAWLSSTVVFALIAAIMGIYARENGQGMVFDLEPAVDEDEDLDVEDDMPPPNDEPPRPTGRPSLKVVK